jgi:hypothetical protein
MTFDFLFHLFWYYQLTNPERMTLICSNEIVKIWTHQSFNHAQFPKFLTFIALSSAPIWIQPNFQQISLHPHHSSLRLPHLTNITHTRRLKTQKNPRSQHFKQTNRPVLLSQSLDNRVKNWLNMYPDVYAGRRRRWTSSSANTKPEREIKITSNPKSSCVPTARFLRLIERLC